MDVTSREKSRQVDSMHAGGLDKLELGQPCEGHDLRIYGSVLHVIISHMEPQASAPKKAPAPIATFDRIEAALKAVPVSRLPEVYEIFLEMLEDAKDVAAIEAAKDEPTAANPRLHGVKKLQGVDSYRVRVGDYRIIYAVADVGHLITPRGAPMHTLSACVLSDEPVQELVGACSYWLTSNLCNTV